MKSVALLLTCWLIAYAASSQKSNNTLAKAKETVADHVELLFSIHGTC